MRRENNTDNRKIRRFVLFNRLFSTIFFPAAAITAIILISGCSGEPRNWDQTAEIINLSSDGGITVEVDGYPSFEWELYTNPFFEGTAFRSGTSSSKTITIATSGAPAFTDGNPYYLRVRSRYGAWSSKRDTDGNPTFFIYNVSGSIGSVNNPLKIKAKEDLIAISKNDALWDDPAENNFILTEDIDLTGEVWRPIGSSVNPYSGRFFGNGHTVTGLSEFGEDNPRWGFFGYTSGPTISNLSVKLGTITSSNNASMMGGLIGFLYTPSGSSPAVISNCIVTGNLIEETSGTASVGGLIGQVTATAQPITIQNCFSDITVSGRRFVGGLLGMVSGSNTQIVKSCYAAGDVIYTGTTGTGYAGGLIGIWGWGGGTSRLEGCVALNRRIINTSGGNAEMYFIGKDPQVPPTANNYYNKNIYSPDGSALMAAGQYALPLNPFTINRDTVPFSGWDFDKGWKWDNTINRPVPIGNGG